ncbi:MAG: hypothetical protein AAF471_05220 [Myxococcota bacterium]
MMKPSAKKPWSYRIIVFLGFVEIVATFATAVFLVFLWCCSTSGFLEGARQGFLKALEYDPSHFGLLQLGHAHGKLLFMVVFPLALLIFARKRNLAGVRTAAVLLLLRDLGLALGGLGRFPFRAFVIMVLACTKSLRLHFRRAAMGSIPQAGPPYVDPLTQPFCIIAFRSTPSLVHARAYILGERIKP